jgi:uncharacterized protein YgbK (DUF1537 family)
MEIKRLPLQETLQGLPPEWPHDPLPEIHRLLSQAGRKVVVLDDDPTGSQSVYAIPVLTGWTVNDLQAELENDLPAFFILTNSRSFLSEEAVQMNREIGENLALAAERARRPFTVISRSDSTMRGHFPAEVDALADALQVDYDAWLLIPMLHTAGRYTLNDIHYASDGEWLLPVGETAYAQDGTFGYRSSNLRDWVEEKTRGRIPASQVASISLDDIRRGGPQAVYQRLLALPHGCVCVINAASRRDLDVFVQGLLLAEKEGRHYLSRTGPTFVPARIGLAPYPLLDVQSILLPGAPGGLIIVGSYVPRTTGQVQALLEREPVVPLEINVPHLLEGARRDLEISSIASRAVEAIEHGHDVVLYTSRELILGRDREQNLQIGQQVSSSLIAILKRIQARPRYILAKGGITSSDIATRGLGVKRAMVLGQVVPGVSLWQLGPESRFDGLAYLVFPGNVGDQNALAEVVHKLRPPASSL